MSRAPALFIQIVDATGEPVSGGLLYTYVAGTSTLKTTYSDYLKTTPNTNPIVAGADGIVGPIFMTDEEPHKFVEKTAAGVTLRTEDNIYSGRLTSDGITTRVKQIASNPLDYGAIGDGVADESSEVQDAIDAVSGEGVVDLLGLTFRCDSQLVLTSGVTLKNGTLDFSNCTDDEFIKIHGSVTTGSLLLTGDAAYGDAYVSVTALTPTLAAGDLLGVKSDAAYLAGGTYVRGELHEIAEISTLDVYLRGHLDDAYAVADNATAALVSSIDDVTLEKLRIIGQASIAGVHYVISAAAARRLRMKHVDIDGLDSYGVRLSGCFDVTVDYCSFTNGDTYTTGAGIVVAGASKNISIDRCTFVGVRQGVLVNGGGVASTDGPVGIPRHISVTRSRFFAGENAAMTYGHVVVDEHAQYVFIEDNTFIGSGTSGSMTPVAADCVDLTIRRNTIVAEATGTTAIGIRMLSVAPSNTSRKYGILVEGNVIKTLGVGIQWRGSTAPSGTPGTIDEVVIRGNIIASGDDSVRADIVSDAGTDLDFLLIENNVCDNDIDVDDNFAPEIGSVVISRNDAVDVEVSTTTSKITGLRMVQNGLSGHIIVTSVDNVVIDGGKHDGYASITDAETVFVDGMRLSGTVTGPSLLITATSVALNTCTVQNCYFDAAGDAALSIVATTASYWLKICNNIFITDDHVIEVTGVLSNCVISDNLLRRSNDSGSNIYLAGTNPGNLDLFTVANNIIQNGTYGIELSNGGTVLQVHNQFDSIATSDITGTFAGLHLRSKTVTVTGAQIRTLMASPKTIVAGVTGKVLVFVAAYVQFNYDGSGAGFTITAGGDDIQFRFKDGTGELLSQVIETTGLIDQTNDVWTLVTGIYGPAAYGDLMVAASCSGQAIVLDNVGANEFTNGTNSTLEITVFYVEVPVV